MIYIGCITNLPFFLPWICLRPLYILEYLLWICRFVSHNVQNRPYYYIYYPRIRSIHSLERALKKKTIKSSVLTTSFDNVTSYLHLPPLEVGHRWPHRQSYFRNTAGLQWMRDYTLLLLTQGEIWWDALLNKFMWHWSERWETPALFIRL